MTETGRPYGGTNDSSKDEGLPGEHPDNDQVGAAPEQSPRAGQGGMSDDVTHVPDGDGSEEGSESKAPGIADATGPQG